MNRIAWMTAIVSMSMLFAATTFVNAQEPLGPLRQPKVVNGPHGGSLRQVDQVSVETVVSQAGVQVYLLDQSGNAIAVSQGRGVASVRIDGNAKRYRYDLVPDEKGGLIATLDLSKMEGRRLEIDLQLVGMPATGGKGLKFHEVASVPASEQQLANAAINRQKLCPVSGKPLGSMGRPVAVETNDQQVYVCCAGCVGAVKANADKYLAARPTVEVVAAALADAALISKQVRCPVMDEPLGSMGKPIKVLVGSMPMFLCCKGCIKKVQAEPEKYLAILKQQNIDAPLIR